MGKKSVIRLKRLFHGNVELFQDEHLRMLRCIAASSTKKDKSQQPRTNHNQGFFMISINTYVWNQVNNINDSQVI